MDQKTPKKYMHEMIDARFLRACHRTTPKDSAVVARTTKS